MAMAQNLLFTYLGEEPFSKQLFLGTWGTRVLTHNQMTLRPAHLRSCEPLDPHRYLEGGGTYHPLVSWIISAHNPPKNHPESMCVILPTAPYFVSPKKQAVSDAECPICHGMLGWLGKFWDTAAGVWPEPGTIGLPSGKHAKNYGKQPSLIDFIGKPTINGVNKHYGHGFNSELLVIARGYFVQFANWNMIH